MRTIFIAAFNPFILRNILIGDALSVLKAEPDSRVVVLVPDYKVDFFKKAIGGDRVLIEGVKTQIISRQDIFFRFVNSSLANTDSLSIHKRTQLEQGRNFPRFLAALLLMKVFGRLKAIRNLSRLADYLTIDKARFSGLFDRYQPDLVFSTDVFHDDDVHLLAAAKKRSVKTVGMVRSWDNFTTKGIFRIRPDALIVHNEIMKDEALRHSGMIAKDIFISGIPQYDRYFSGQRMAREDFFKKIGLDPAKKMILFSPFGKRFTDTDWQVMEILKEFIEKKLIPPSQVLVRFTPNDEVPLGKFEPSGDFYMDKPGHQFKVGVFRDQELNASDMDWLADSLANADVVVAGGASIGVDAAAFDKPAILIYFDGFEDRPILRSVRRFIDYSHGKLVNRDGSVMPARSREELLSCLNQALGSPASGRELRKKMIERMCWKTDGQAGKRIGNFLSAMWSQRYR